MQCEKHVMDEPLQKSISCPHSSVDLVVHRMLIIFLLLQSFFSKRHSKHRTTLQNWKNNNNYSNNKLKFCLGNISHPTQIGEEHLAARHTKTIRRHYAGHGKELEERGLLFNCDGQHGKNEKTIKKFISRQKNNKKCK